jgi:peptidoglycan/LPS O-acetylase OafA/YrhL
VRKRFEALAAMDRNTSIYLDAVRFAAALAVLLSHVEGGWVPGIMPAMAHLGLEAVAVFFVLSGFVIGYATTTRERDAGTYAINRAARLYSVVVPCLALTVVLDMIGHHWHLAPYQLDWTHDWGTAKEPLKAGFSLLFLNEIWGWGMLPGSNLPFWSLAYEVPYYVIFGLALFLPRALGLARAWGVALAAVALAVAGPAIAALFPIWLLGLALYHAGQRVRLSQLTARALGAGAILAWLGTEWLRWHYRWGWDAPILMGWSTMWHFYLVAPLFAATILAVRDAGLDLGPIAGPVRWCAGATFTLYLVHFPVAHFLSAFIPQTWPGWGQWAAIVLPTLAVAFLLAAVTERKKGAWRQAMLWGARQLSVSVRTPVTPEPVG